MISDFKDSLDDKVEARTTEEDCAGRCEACSGTETDWVGTDSVIQDHVKPTQKQNPSHRICNDLT